MGYNNREEYDEWEVGARMTILVTRRHPVKAESLKEARKVMDELGDDFIDIDRETLPDDAEVADCYIDSNNDSNSFECVIVYEIVREAYEKDGDWYAKDEDDLPEDCEFKRVVDSRGQILCEWI